VATECGGVANDTMIDSIHDLDTHNRDPASEPISSEFPVQIWKLVAFGYGALVVIALFMFSRDVNTAYVATIACGIALMYFGLPWVLMKTEARNGHGRRRSMIDFLGKGLRTRTGLLDGHEALLQILLIPTVLACGMLVISLIDVFVRP